MEQFIHNNTTYISADYILKNATLFCKGSRNSRDLLRRKNITQDNYIFVRKDRKTFDFTISDGTSPKVDRVFIAESYLKEISELNDQKTNLDDGGIEIAPEIIYLKESEKFRCKDGNALDIETRGVRECNGIYFRVSDIERCFQMKNLQKTIIDTHTSYLIDRDYKYFICKKGHDVSLPTSKKLFLTYHGILRCLMISQNNKTSHFISWATNCLFTIQMGTEEQKNTLVSNIKGVSYESIQEIFSVSSSDLPCIYLTSLNEVKSLRKEMNLDERYKDNDIVFKFGLTKSFKQRKKRP